MKDEATPEQLAMARRIADDQTGPNNRGHYLWEPRYNAALAAIIETQRLDAELAARETGKYPHGSLMYGDAAAHKIATAIRAGKHYGKDEGKC